VRVLRDSLVQVVLDHHLDRLRLPAPARVLVDVPRAHLVRRAEAAHVDAPVARELLGELGRELGVQPRGKVAQGVPDGELLLGVGEQHRPRRRVVDAGLLLGHRGDRVGDAGRYLRLEVVHRFLREENHAHPPRCNRRSRFAWGG